MALSRSGPFSTPLGKAVLLLVVFGTLALVAFSRRYGSPEAQQERARAAASADAARMRAENLHRAGVR